MKLRYSANLSMLYPQTPFMDRFVNAAADGFKTVEILFPSEYGIQAVQSQLKASGLKLALFNLPPGDPPGEWGTLSSPSRRDFFRHSFRKALDDAGQLGCQRLNMMFGNRLDWALPEAQVDCALENLAWAAPQAAAAGVTLLIEPLNPVDFPDIFLRTTKDAVDILSQVNHPQVRLLYDVYHAQMNEGNLIGTLRACFSWIGHIQIADVPGRHQPGTGEIRFSAIFAALEDLGYQGYIGLEYRPLGTMEEALSWLPLDARSNP